MSVFTTHQFTCPECGAPLEFDSFDSINADRRPDLREDILAGSLSLVHCEACDEDFRPEPNLNYLDYKNGIWIMAHPIYNLAYWEVEEQKTAKLFADAYGKNAPAAAREIGEGLTPRLTFGWAAFREKLILMEAALDDVVIEKTKLAILVNRAGNPIEAGVELRLINARERVFRMAWMNAATGVSVQQFEIQRALYESTEAGDDWAEIEEKLNSGIFVDIQRMFIEPMAKNEAG